MPPGMGEFVGHDRHHLVSAKGGEQAVGHHHPPPATDETGHSRIHEGSAGRPEERVEAPTRPAGTSPRASCGPRRWERPGSITRTTIHGATARTGRAADGDQRRQPRGIDRGLGEPPGPAPHRHEQGERDGNTSIWVRPGATHAGRVGNWTGTPSSSSRSSDDSRTRSERLEDPPSEDDRTEGGTIVTTSSINGGSPIHDRTVSRQPSPTTPNTGARPPTTGTAAGAGPPGRSARRGPRRPRCSNQEAIATATTSVPVPPTTIMTTGPGAAGSIRPGRRTTAARMNRAPAPVSRAFEGRRDRPRCRAVPVGVQGPAVDEREARQFARHPLA